MPRAPSAKRSLSCSAVGARLMSEAECRSVATAPVWREARRWIGASTNPTEHPGCLLWDDGGVEYNPHQDQSMGCNVKGVCLCAEGGASSSTRTVEVLGAGLARGNTRFEPTTTILALEDAE